MLFYIGHISLWALARLFEAGRVMAFKKSSILSYNVLRKDYVQAMITGRYAISRELSKQSSGLNFGVKLNIFLAIVDIGRSSVHMYSEIKDAETGVRLGWVLAKMVYIDPAIRKAKPLPVWLATKYGEEVKKNALSVTKVIGAGLMPLKASDLILPADMFKYEIAVAPSDTDSNGHTNNSSYIRFCMDAATMAVREGALKGFYKDMVLYHVKTVTVFYAHETHTGDELVVYLWKEPGDHLEVCFVLTRKGKRVFNSKIVFYPLTTSKY